MHESGPAPKGKAPIVKAYDAYQSKKTDSCAFDELVTAVLHFFRQSHPHDDDAAQELALSIWKKMETWSGTGDEFFSYLNKASWNAAKSEYRNTVRTLKKFEPLMVPAANGSIKENPKMYDFKHSSDIQTCATGIHYRGEPKNM